MQIDFSSISDTKVRAFYSLTWTKHRILRDFYTCLTEGQYDFRMIDIPARKSYD